MCVASIYSWALLKRRKSILHVWMWQVNTGLYTPDIRATVNCGRTLKIRDGKDSC